jgi:acetylornithine/succinyldiaminopimelate/putrescine aminotransferase
VTVHVTKTNSHARAAKGTDQAYTLNHAKAKLHGETAATLTAGSRVKLSGKVTTLAKKCDHTGFTPTVTIKKADIKPPKPYTI